MKPGIKHLAVEAYKKDSNEPSIFAVFTTGVGNEDVNEFNLTSFAFAKDIDHLVVRPATKEETDDFGCTDESMDDQWGQLHWLKRCTEEGEELYLTLEDKASGTRLVTTACYYRNDDGTISFDGIDETRYEVIRYQKMPNLVTPAPYSGPKVVEDKEWEELLNNPGVFTDEELENGATSITLTADGQRIVR